MDLKAQVQVPVPLVQEQPNPKESEFDPGMVGGKIFVYFFFKRFKSHGWWVGGL